MKLLERTHYHLAIPGIEKLEFNTYFAQSVVRQHVGGMVYANSLENPDTFYVLHPYGMSLLFGNSSHDIFNKILRDYIFNSNGKRNRVEWLQVFPNKWNKILTDLLGKKPATDISTEVINEAKVVEYTRLNFKFNRKKYFDRRNKYRNNHFIMVQTNEEMFNRTDGSVVPKYFWPDARRFCKSGIGFSLIIRGEFASTAFSGFIHGNNLELGIETNNKFRGKGLAYQCCSKLIDYCLDNHYEPVWACREDNISSVKLAQKLGFELIASRPYYELKL